jgi:diguanylate cyclase (GGDEF)-like protein/PAS domain S-box-containing protein
MRLTEVDLARYAGVPTACWVQDVERARVIWANDAALRVFRAESAEEFYARDMTPLSKASETRLLAYRDRVSDGEIHTTQWTTFVDGLTPLTLLARISGYVLPDQRVALFFEARDVTDATCAESLRMLESARQSHVCFGLFSISGVILEQNAAFLRTFALHRVANPSHSNDNYAALFVQRADAERVRALCIAKGEYRGRARLRDLSGERWYLIIAITIKDPVDGAKVLQVELIDIANEVESEERARVSEQLLQQIADEVPQPIAYLRSDEKFGFVNRTYASWSGRSRDEIIGKYLSEIASQKAVALLHSGLPKVAAGERFQYERIAPIAGLDERWVRVELVPHFDENNNVAGSFIFGTDINALKLAEAGKQASVRQLETIADNLPVAIALFGLDNRLQFANTKFASWFRVPRDSMLGRHAAEIFGKETFESTNAARALAQTGEPSSFRREVEFHGKSRWIDITIAPFMPDQTVDALGSVDGYVAVYSDVTTNVRASKAHSATKDALARHIENTPLIVIELDGTQKIRQWTGRATEVFGWTEAHAMGNTLADLMILDDDAREDFEAHLLRLRLGESDRFTALLRGRRRDGAVMYGEWFGSAVQMNERRNMNGQGSTESATTVQQDQSYLLLVQDVTARVSAERHLQYVANHDALTGLPNRNQFHERLKQELVRARRHGHRIAVFMVDVDRFKYVNESMGHNAGDVLLQQLAARLSGASTASDLVARTGGDEFMLMTELDSDGHAASIARGMQLVVEQPFHVLGQDIYVTLSIGASIFPDDAEGEQELVKNADWALFRAKDAGRSNAQFYSRTVANDAPSRLSLETDLRKAVELSQFELHYQPKQSMIDGRITGAEALLRWRHPLRGLVQPDQFITLAEETGFIVEIGRWVCQQACRQATLWREQYGTAPQIAINISPMQLAVRGLAEDILAELQAAKLPGSALMVEVTESGVVSDPFLAMQTLESLRAHGVQAAIDDFGKGYSSLTQLKRLPIDALKIDAAFVRDVVSDRDDAAIIQAIIGLGRSLDLHVIAEGVETHEQMSLLLKYGCDQVQGYFVSRPIPAAEFAATFLQPFPT